MSDRRVAQPTPARLAAMATAAGICGRIGARDLVELPRRGLAHRHWRLKHGLLLRVPLTGGPDAAAALQRQAETFRRMAPSGHAPRLHGVLPPSAGLPGGALIVDEIRGREPAVPRDFTALAEALAAIHALPLPPPGARTPLASPADPFAATLATIERHIARARRRLPAGVLRQLDCELDWARVYGAVHGRDLRDAPRSLVVTDAHPRNFVIRPDGRAVCVDLEKALYGAAAIDLAHASLPAAIAWGRRGERVTAADRAHFVDVYFQRRGLAVERALRPFVAPLRRLTWLRTTAAFAAFQASGAEDVLGPAARALARHAIAHALDPAHLQRDRMELAHLRSVCKARGTTLE
jgi:Phosphotransferase enzyme family